MERGARATVSSVVVLVLTASSILIPALTSSAATPMSFSGGVLRFTGDTDPQYVAPGCSAGNVTDNAVPIPGPVPCSGVTHLIVNTGGGIDTVTLAGLLPADFTTLTNIDVNLGKGRDTAAVGLIESDLSGGSGSDAIEVQGVTPGSYTLSPSGLVAPVESASLDSFESASVHLSNGTNSFDAYTFPGRISVVGGSGADFVNGSKFDDSFSLGGGVDVANGNDGEDAFTGAAGNDVFYGGSGEDRIFETALTSHIVLTDTSMTGNGSDALSSVESAIVGHTGSTGFVDSLAGFSGKATWFGANGDDSVIGSQGGTYFAPGGGWDTVEGGPGEDTIHATNLSVGTLTPSSLVGPLTTDHFTGIERFFLSGTSGDDTLDASAFAGPTDMAGNSGSDVMIGGPGTSTFFADGGDTVTGGNGRDEVDTSVQGPGTAMLTDAGMTGLVSFTMSSIEGAQVNVLDATLKASGFSGRLVGFGSDQDEKILAGKGNDRLVLSGGNDLGDGGRGKDLLSGGPGKDLLAGGPGADKCKGGPGTDILSTCE